MTGTIVAQTKDEAGFTLIDMLFVVAMIGLLSTLAIPGLMRARGTAMSASAVGTLRLVNSAQLSYAITCGLGFYSPDFPTLAVKPPGSVEAFLTPELATGPTFIKSGYNFSLAGTSMAGAPATCNGLGIGQSAAGYAVVADQLDLTAPTVRHYGTNTDGMIYQHTQSLAGVMPEGGPPPNGHIIQ